MSDAPDTQEQSNENNHECEFVYQDDSFDHEFGTQIVHTWVCAHCGKRSPYTGPPATQEQSNEE